MLKTKQASVFFSVFYFRDSHLEMRFLELVPLGGFSSIKSVEIKWWCWDSVFSLSSSTFYVVLIHRVAYLDVAFVLWFWSFLVAAMGSHFVQSYVVVTRNFYLYMRLIVVRCRASKTFPRVSMCVRDSGSQMDLKYVTSVRFNFKYKHIGSYRFSSWSTT